MTTNDELAFYTSPGPLTEIPDRAGLLAGLPGRAEDLCRVSQGLIVHEFLAEQYGVAEVGQRVGELENRSTTEILAAVERLDSRPLARPREPEHRMIGNCRHFTVLTCALLRRAGVPARARAGFAGYFGDGWTDHWVVERWDAARGRWKRTDAQLDETQRELFGYQFDPLDLPEEAFLTGGEAWRRCRGGDEDPTRFGIHDMRGLWFVAGNVIRDLAALNKVELLPWDTWGVMDLAIGEVEDERTALMDTVSAALVGGTPREWRELYQRDGLRVPSAVRSERFQREVPVPTAA